MANTQKLHRTVTFTSLEKKAEGHKTGRYTKTFTEAHYEPGELDKLIQEMREEQTRKNNRFRGAQRIQRETGAPEEPAEKEEGRAPSIKEMPSEARFAPPAAEKRIYLRLDEGTGNSTALIGSSKQGKSTCMMELYRQNYSSNDCISTLFAANPQIRLYSGTHLISCPTYDPRLIKLAHTINRKTKNAYDFCFLLDDIVDKRDDTVLKQLILTLRNSNLSSMVCLQFTNLLAKVSRANVNNLLLFGFNSDEAVELTCKQFLSAHLREKKVPPSAWTQYYRDATRDHGFIYVHPDSGTVSYHRLAL